MCLRPKSLSGATNTRPSGAVVTCDGAPARIQDAIDTGFFGARNVAATFEGAKCAAAPDDCAGVMFERIDRSPRSAPAAAGAARHSALSLSGEVGVEITLNPSAHAFDVTDPEAARMTLRAHWPRIDVTTVDVSIKAMFTEEMLAAIAKSPNPAAQYIAKYSQERYYLWDEMAACAMA